METPKESVLFFKATTALAGPNDDLVIPRNGHKVYWEVELAVVIGRKALISGYSRQSNMWRDTSCTTMTRSERFNWNVADNG
jgi:2-keto-4-pentenoate hydratase/2-oxohepta-3-ene-1,7-dioic acid hydratase in catechol pathway